MNNIKLNLYINLIKYEQIFPMKIVNTLILYI